MWILWMLLGMLPSGRPSTMFVALVKVSVLALMVASVRPNLRCSVWQTTQ